jgi:hypothetical protein
METTKGLPRIVAGVGLGLLAMALLWWTVAVPALVKYPTDINATPRYEGTFSVFVDQGTFAPLASPQQLPLTVERHIQAIGDQSGADTVLVDETITQHAGSLVNTTQHNVYVMDRSTAKNIADSRAYAFDPSNVLDRSGSYRVNLPFDTNAGSTYPIFKNEIGTTYLMQGDATNPTTSEHGLDLKNFTATVTEAPLSAAYLAELSKSVPLPTSMTLDQLKPQLKQLGVDVDALLASMGPHLTPSELSTLAAISAKPIPLHYVLSFSGHAAVEPTTGAEVDVGATESIGARPELADLPALQAILANHADVPAAATAGQALQNLTTAPAVKLFEYSYQQTPASVADIAGQVESNRNDVILVKRYMPFGLVGLSALAFGTSAVIVLRRRRPTQPVDLRTGPPAIERVPEREHATTGGSR